LGFEHRVTCGRDPNSSRMSPAGVAGYPRAGESLGLLSVLRRGLGTAQALFASCECVDGVARA
jgi:hypothetical protein